MSKNNPLLSSEKIIAYCSELVTPLAIEVVPQTGSTNADLMARVATLDRPTLLVADKQTAGRGRAGRRWLSASTTGSSLTFSLAWPFFKKPQALLGLSLAIGVALAEALISMGVEVQLKWPNDVLRGRKKLGGVLIETSHYVNQTWAIIGIGLNLQITEELEQQIGQPIANAACLAQIDKNKLLATLINYLVSCLKKFSISGFSTFLPTWNALHAYAGEHVCIIDQDRIIYQGVALGVDNLGCLLVQDQCGIARPIMAGDVSLRHRENRYS